MFPLRTAVMLLCLQLGEVYNAVHIAGMMNLQVEFGQSALLPCNGSAYLEEEGGVQWEAMGDDVAILRGGELREGDKFKGRVRLPSEEQLREGDWSVVLQRATLSDTDMYECILEGRKTISTVWLTVTVPHVEQSLEVPLGDPVHLPCYFHIPRSQSFKDLTVWWTRNGSTIVSRTGEDLIPTILDTTYWTSVLFDPEGQFDLSVSSTMPSDSGEYRCLYKTRDSDDPRPGKPETLTLTVVETKPTHLVFHHDDTTTSGDWVGTTLLTTDSPPDLTPVLLEDPTQPIKVTTELQPMEAFEETATSFPREVFFSTTSQPSEAFEETVMAFLDEGGATETSAESLQWESLPWVRIGLIAGVLLVTALVLCILGALQQI